MPTNNRATRRIAIIGSGFSGLCLGIQLKRLGIDSFTIFEKADRHRRHLAREYISGRGVRRAVVFILLLVRAEDGLVAEVGAAAGNPRVHGGLREKYDLLPPHPIRH